MMPSVSYSKKSDHLLSSWSLKLKVTFVTSSMSLLKRAFNFFWHSEYHFFRNRFYFLIFQEKCNPRPRLYVLQWLCPEQFLVLERTEESHQLFIGCFSHANCITTHSVHRPQGWTPIPGNSSAFFHSQMCTENVTPWCTSQMIPHPSPHRWRRSKALYLPRCPLPPPMWGCQSPWKATSSML